MSTHALETLSNQAVAFAGVVYFLAIVCHSVEWGKLLSRKQVVAAVTTATAKGGVAVQDRPVFDDDRADYWGRLGYSMTCVAVAVHLVAVVSRGAAAGRVPWGNMYEFTLSGTCLVGLAYVLLYRKLKLNWMGPFVVGFVFVFLMVAVVVLYLPVEPLTESLNSYWLIIHVVAAVISTGAFTLGGITAAVYLVKERWVRKHEGEQPRGWLARVPSLTRLDRTAYSIHAFAFPLWTFAVLIAGPVWAHQAWGSYWNWDPKEVWAFITWVVYAGYLHARATVGWKGRRAATLALVGVATLWFNFIGINYFSSTSMHSYAGGVVSGSPAAPALDPAADSPSPLRGSDRGAGPVSVGEPLTTAGVTL